MPSTTGEGWGVRCMAGGGQGGKKIIRSHTNTHRQRTTPPTPTHTRQEQYTNGVKCNRGGYRGGKEGDIQQGGGGRYRRGESAKYTRGGPKTGGSARGMIRAQKLQSEA